MLPDSQNLFGNALNEYRLKKGLSLREMSTTLDISHVYLRNIELGRKSPPGDNLLIKISQVLQLNNQEKALFFDLAALTKEVRNPKNHYLPADISSYLSSMPSATRLIRKANELNLKSDFWRMLIQQLENDNKQ